MPTDNLKTPRTTQSAALSTQALAPNEVANPTPKKKVLMTRAQWKETSKDFKIFSRKTGRFVMHHSPQGIGLFPVEIVD